MSARATRPAPPAAVVREAEGYVQRQQCPWQTALAILRVTQAEDLRWRADAQDAEEAGTLAPGSESARWLELHRLAMRRVARAAGALQRTASGKGRGGGPAVAAAAKLLEVEAVDAWGRTREAEAQGGDQERERVELAAFELATPEERAEIARLSERARVDAERSRELYQALLSRLRASETARR